MLFLAALLAAVVTVNAQYPWGPDSSCDNTKCQYQTRKCVQENYCEDNSYDLYSMGGSQPCGGSTTESRSTCFICDNGDMVGDGDQYSCIDNYCAPVTQVVGAQCCGSFGGSGNNDCNDDITDLYCRSGSFCDFNATKGFGICTAPPASGLGLTATQACTVYDWLTDPDEIPEDLDTCTSNLLCTPSADMDPNNWFGPSLKINGSTTGEAGTCVYAQFGNFEPGNCTSTFDCAVDQWCNPDQICVPGSCIGSSDDECVCMSDYDCDSTLECQWMNPQDTSLGGVCRSRFTRKFGEPCDNDFSNACASGLYCSGFGFCDRPSQECGCTLADSGSCGRGKRCECPPTGLATAGDRPLCRGTAILNADGARWAYNNGGKDHYQCVEDENIPRFAGSAGYRSFYDQCLDQDALDSDALRSDYYGLKTCNSLISNPPRYGMDYTGSGASQLAPALLVLLAPLIALLVQQE